MTRTHVTIACEGPRCNNGASALVREHALAAELPSQTVDLRDEANRHARAAATRALAVTPHTYLQRNRGGVLIFCCDHCGHERVYGNVFDGWMHATEGDKASA